MKSQVFTLCDAILLVRPQEKFEIDNSWDERFGPTRTAGLGLIVVSLDSIINEHAAPLRLVNGLSMFAYVRCFVGSAHLSAMCCALSWRQ